MKKVFIISSVLLCITLFFLAVYNLAFKKETTPQTFSQNITVEPIRTTEPPKKIEKIIAVSDQPVIGTVFNAKTETITYYDAEDGTVWTMDAKGKAKNQISSVSIADLKNVVWSPDQTKVLTTIEKNGKNLFYEYDYNLKKSTALKEGLDTTAWDNAGSKIFYKYFDQASKTRTLNIANPDGSEWQKLADIESRNLSVSAIPLSAMVSFWNSPNAREETKLQIVGATGGEVKTIFTGKYGGDYLWSPDGSQALISSLQSNDSKMITLGIVTINGEYRDLNVPTMVSKCVWSSDSKTAYCTLAGGIPDSATMPNDYQEGKFTSSDTFWKVDTSTGEKSRIIETADITGKYDASKLFLSGTEDALYFVNKIDQKLYKIQL